MTTYRAALMVHGPGPSGGITPVNASASYVLGATILGAGAANAVVFAHQPDVTRVLTVTGSALNMRGTVTITGRDCAGNGITDTFVLHDTDTVAGTKAFATVLNVAMPAKTNGSGDTLTVGVANVFGIQHMLTLASRLFIKEFNASTDAGSLVVNPTVLSQNLYTLAGTPNGSRSLDLFYLIG